MNRHLLPLVFAAGLALAACSGSEEPTARDEPNDPMPTSVPMPAGDVLGQGMVIDSPNGPIFCMGAVAESYPPQCGVGPGTLTLTNWKWKPVREYIDSGSDLRFGTFALQGTLSGDSLTLTADAIPLALYDPMVAVDDRACVAPEQDPDELAAALADLPGSWGSYPGSGDEPCLHTQVLFDDGTLQDWVDVTYGVGAVKVMSALAEVSS